LIKLIIFDLDGTLTKPYLDFAVIRRALGITNSDTLVLDHMLSLPSPEREKAFETVERFEAEAAENAQLRPGALDVVNRLRAGGKLVAINTRNSARSVDIVSRKFGIETDAAITRESPFPPKPDPAAIEDLLCRLGVSRSEAIMVGDFSVDVEAGKRAGLRTVLLTGDDPRTRNAGPDALIDNLSELLPLVEKWDGS